MPRYRYFLVYKPFQVLSQFTDPVGGKRTLGELYDFPKDVYPVGRLDEDSEGLLLLTNDPRLNQKLLGQGVEKEYYVQVEGIPTDEALQQLRAGVDIRVRKKHHHTLPAKVRRLDPAPELPATLPSRQTLLRGSGPMLLRLYLSSGYSSIRAAMANANVMENPT